MAFPPSCGAMPMSGANRPGCVNLRVAGMPWVETHGRAVQLRVQCRKTPCNKKHPGEMSLMNGFRWESCIVTLIHYSLVHFPCLNNSVVDPSCIHAWIIHIMINQITHDGFIPRDRGVFAGFASARFWLPKWLRTAPTAGHQSPKKNTSKSDLFENWLNSWETSPNLSNFNVHIKKFKTFWKLIVGSHAMTKVKWPYDQLCPSQDPFSHFDFDGVLGLGLQTLALSGTGWLEDIGSWDHWARSKRIQPWRLAKIWNPGDCRFSSMRRKASHLRATQCGQIPIWWLPEIGVPPTHPF